MSNDRAQAVAFHRAATALIQPDVVEAIALFAQEEKRKLENNLRTAQTERDLGNVQGQMITLTALATFHDTARLNAQRMQETNGSTGAGSTAI